MFKRILRHKKMIVAIVKIILKDGYNYNALTRHILMELTNKSSLAYTLTWFDSLYTDAGHTRIERKDGKIIITLEGNF